MLVRSPYIVNWDLRKSMTQAYIEIILEHARELQSEARKRRQTRRITPLEVRRAPVQSRR